MFIVSGREGDCVGVLTKSEKPRRASPSILLPWLAEDENAKLFKQGIEEVVCYIYFIYYHKLMLIGTRTSLFKKLEIEIFLWSWVNFLEEPILNTPHQKTKNKNTLNFEVEPSESKENWKNIEFFFIQKINYYERTCQNKALVIHSSILSGGLRKKGVPGMTLHCIWSCFNSGMCVVPLHFHYSQVYSYPEW